MRGDDPPDDPVDDLLRELERMIDEMMSDMTRDSSVDTTGESDPSTHPDAHTDVHELNDRIRVVADIPGVNADAITMECDDTVLRIDAAGDRNEYDEHIPLPTRVDPTSAETTYNNGILTVTFDRMETATGIDRS